MILASTGDFSPEFNEAVDLRMYVALYDHSCYGLWAESSI
jgi:hypothetical protein